MLPITLVGAGIACGRYEDTVGECPACREIATVFCSECGCCLDCCECGDEEDEY